MNWISPSSKTARRYGAFRGAPKPRRLDPLPDPLRLQKSPVLPSGLKESSVLSCKFAA